MENAFGFDFDTYYAKANPLPEPLQPGRIKQEEEEPSAVEAEDDHQAMDPRSEDEEEVADASMYGRRIEAVNLEPAQQWHQPQHRHPEPVHSHHHHSHARPRNSPSPSKEQLRGHDEARHEQQAQQWHQQEHSAPEPVLSLHQYEQEDQQARRRRSPSPSPEQLRDSATTASTHRRSVPHHHQQQQQAVKYSTTNGEGQWEAWCRNFNTPLDALGDLFDNCVDACFMDSRDNTATTNQATIEVGLASQDGTNGLVLTNTCRGEVKPIATVLEVNTRSKKDSKEQIGENGVGLKQASANLSNLSLVLIKSPSQFSLGILWKDLQKDTVCIPSIEFPNPDYYDEQSYNDSLPSLHDQLLEACTATNPGEIGLAVQRYGGNDLDTGIKRLLAHYNEMTNSPRWENSPSVFRLILHELRHGGKAKQEIALKAAGVHTVLTSPAETNRVRCLNLMHDLAAEAPKLYIHIPDSLTVIVNNVSLKFRYWENRLTQLTQFSILVDTKHSYTKSDFWNTDYNGTSTFATSITELRVFCGFDSYRILEKRGAGLHGHISKKTGVPCSLLIHSRQSGRKLDYEVDARSTLGLTHGGTDYCQGMVMILDDFNSTLPPNPTKQGIGFGKDVYGQTHRDNLYAMVGAVAHLYWQYYKDRCFGSKKILTDAVKESHKRIREISQQGLLLGSLSNGDFNHFNEKIPWKKANQDIRCPITKSKSLTVSFGNDSLVNLKPEPPLHMMEQPNNKRRRLSVGNTDDGLGATAGSSQYTGDGTIANDRNNNDGNTASPSFSSWPNEEPVPIPTLSTSGNIHVQVEEEQEVAAQTNENTEVDPVDMVVDGGGSTVEFTTARSTEKFSDRIQDAASAPIISGVTVEEYQKMMKELESKKKMIKMLLDQKEKDRDQKEKDSKWINDLEDALFTSEAENEQLRRELAVLRKI